MRFQEVYDGWRERRLSQSEAAEILGVCERSFRRFSYSHTTVRVHRYVDATL